MKRAAALMLATLLTPLSVEAGSLFDPAYRVVIPTDQGRTFLAPGCNALPEGIREKVSDFWMPGDADIAAAEQHLAFAYIKAIRGASWIGPVSQGRLVDWESVANHARQYAGVVQNGRKKILVVAAPIYVFDFDGRHDLVLPQDLQAKFFARGVCDGGPSQFSVLYDPASATYGEFYFTGTLVGYNLP
jgi:hypothetical protein